MPERNSAPDLDISAEGFETGALYRDDTDRMIMRSSRYLIINQGILGTTMAAIARAAGISRPTLYARYPNLDAIVRQVLNLEIIGLLECAFPIPNDVDSFIESVIAVAEKAVDNELLTSIIQHDPEALVTYQYKRLGRSQKTLIRFTRNIISKLQSAEPEPGGRCIRRDDPEVLAAFVLATTQAVALQSKALVSVLSERADWKQELGKILEGYLVHVRVDTQSECGPQLGTPDE